MPDLATSLQGRSPGKTSQRGCGQSEISPCDAAAKLSLREEREGEKIEHTDGTMHTGARDRRGEDRNVLEIGEVVDQRGRF